MSYGSFSQQPQHGSVPVPRFTPANVLFESMVRGDANATVRRDQSTFDPNAQRLERPVLRHAQVLPPQRYFVSFEGTEAQLGEDANRRLFKFTDAAKTKHNAEFETDPDGNPVQLILLETRVTQVRNTTGHDVAITLGTGTQVNIGTTLRDGRTVAFIIPANKPSTTEPDGGVVIYRRDLANVRPIGESFIDWVYSTPERLQADILSKNEEAGQWIIDGQSPIIEAANQLHELGKLVLTPANYFPYIADGVDANGMFVPGKQTAILEATVAQKSIDFIGEVIKTFPFERPGDLTATVSRVDNQRFSSVSTDVGSNAATESASLYQPLADPNRQHKIDAIIERHYAVHHVAPNY